MNVHETYHDPMERPFLTPEAAAEYMNITVGSLYQRKFRNQVKAYKFGRLLRFKKEDLDACMKEER